jgi:hypothetical protein
MNEAAGQLDLAASPPNRSRALSLGRSGKSGELVTGVLPAGVGI